ncbi:MULTISPECIES: peptidoglycan-associated lipoprotein Pal [Paracoccaceae]|uniref:peptidoglycan-associated lipoprotein Pal n=1 Tax=Rhodobacterales TaxID=204455 RepID=UPI001B22C599|nr:peptidoglycan-associated lipoprotein Pal [Boseongicola sp. H5]MBO6604816.1 peptidoglycan-associated lipoprotein Pal [Roseicyclus sp.]MBO6624664.1 peptidoglycan-associated lipoprotein Pal [Roseicyclus sp.]MBO6921656.1 peptidoglycan-associated lipoprotein Pal [Roseicyclus sp.]
MNILMKSALLVAVLGLSACAQGGLGGNTAGALNGAGQQGAFDPTSPAYFNQTVGDRVLFAVDQSTLAPDARATLDGQAQWLLTNTEYTVLIEGHADEQGTREYNLALGARRASAVEEYLISRGVAANRLRTISYGKERPIEICSDESCYRQNRRAVSVIAAGAGAGV